MARGLKWHPKLTHFESQIFSRIPKAVLFVVARQFAAQLLGSPDDVHQNGHTGDLICKEWEAQFLSGNVPQKPPKIVRASEF